MLKYFWVIVVLIGVLLFKNARDVVVQYSIDKNKAKILVYMGPLLLLGYILFHLSVQVFNFVEASQDMDQTAGVSVPHYYKPYHAASSVASSEADPD